MMTDSNIKAALKISLFAGNTLVAQSEDPKLWQKIFSAITSTAIESDTEHFSKPASNKSKTSFESSSDSPEGIGKFARILDMTEDEIQGACQPSLESPYLQLNPNYYESFVKSIPFRGPGAVSRIGLAGTLLCLWFDSAKFGRQPTIAECQAVLSTIHISESNLTRSLKNSFWLQKTTQGLVINPAKRSKALEIAKKYCSEGAE